MLAVLVHFPADSSDAGCQFAQVKINRARASSGWYLSERGEKKQVRSWPLVFAMTTIISARSHKGKWCHDMTWVWTGTTKWKLISVFEEKRWLLGFRWATAGVLSWDIRPVPAVRAWQGSMFAWRRPDLLPLQHDRMNRTGYSSMSVCTLLVSRLSGPAELFQNSVLTIFSSNPCHLTFSLWNCHKITHHLEFYGELLNMIRYDCRASHNFIRSVKDVTIKCQGRLLESLCWLVLMLRRCQIYFSILFMVMWF